MTGTLKGTVTAPRLRHVLPFLQSVADHLDLDFTVLWHDLGWWSETIRFQFKGEDAMLERAQTYIKQAEDQ